MKQTNKIRKLQRILNRIKKYKSKIAAMTDEQLADMTRVFRERLAQGVSLDELLRKRMPLSVRLIIVFLANSPMMCRFLVGLHCIRDIWQR